MRKRALRSSGSTAIRAVGACDDAEMASGAAEAGSVHVSNRAGKAAYLAVAIVGVLISLAMFVGGKQEALFPGLLVGLPSLFVLSRVPRIGLTATNLEVVVRNVGRTYRVPKAQLSAITVGSGSHSTDLTSALIVERDGSKPITAMGTASYSRSKVEVMLSQVQQES
jgi:hypothetical protein